MAHETHKSSSIALKLLRWKIYIRWYSWPIYPFQQFDFKKIVLGQFIFDNTL